MSELKLGKMTWREISVWFGLQQDTLNKNPKSKEKKLNILKKYADYHIEGKTVYIDKIYIPEYSKAYDIIDREFSQEWNQETKIDTCSRVGKAIYEKHAELQAQVSESTAKVYTNKVKVERYGKNHLQNSRGTCGYSKYIWMEKNGKEPLSDEKLKKLRECAAAAYKDSSEQIAAIDDDFRKGNLTQEERIEAIGNIDTNEAYNRFITLVIEAIGFMPIKKTLLIDEEGTAWAVDII